MFVPSPKLNETSVPTTRTTLTALARVICSKAKFPRKVWPASLKSRSARSTRRYGPAGTSRLTVFTPTVIISLTAAVVVFTDTAKVPLKFRSSDGAVATVALNVPARPASVTTKLPMPLVAVSSAVLPSPRLKEPLATPTRNTSWFAAVFICSITKSPLRRWPRMSRYTPVPLTCRYGPAGRLTRPRAASFTAAVVLLMRTLNVPPAVTSGMLSAILPLMSATSPPVPRRKMPAPSVRLRKVVVPLPRLRVTLVPAMMVEPA